jgi:hypothetical protein
MKLNFDLIIYEAQIFGQTLDQTVIRIHSDAFGALASAFEKQNEAVEQWSEEDTGISNGQLETYIREEWMVQVRALTTMTLTLIETQLHGFLKTNGAFLARYLQRDKERYGAKAWFLRVIAEYEERYGIKLEGVPGFETCREVVLARNACVHEECRPTEDYMQQTARRFLGDDGLLVLNRETLIHATDNLKSFANALARATRKRIDAVKGTAPSGS